MLLADVVATSDSVTSTRARSTKVAALADLLGRLAPDEIEAVVGFLIGEPRQGRIGVGWATVFRLEVTPAAVPTLTIADVDRALDQIQTTTGSGSAASRQHILGDVFGRATTAETDFLRRLLVGELRQGALAGLMGDAVARAAAVPATLVRRAAMLSGDLGHTAVVALTEGAPGLRDVGLEVGRGVLPMLAAGAPDVGTALDDVGPASVEWKLDGARIQVHRVDDEVRIYTRNLNDDQRPIARRRRLGAPLAGARSGARRRGDRRRRRGASSRLPGHDELVRARLGHAAEVPRGRSTRSSSTCCTSTATTSSSDPSGTDWRSSVRSRASGASPVP